MRPQSPANGKPSPTWYEESCRRIEDDRLLSGRVETDVLVIGAGLAGLTTALELSERGQKRIVVVDREAPGAGASGRNGGFVFAGFSLENAELIRQAGAENAKRLHRWTRASVSRIRARCAALEVPTFERGVLLADWFHHSDRLSAHRQEMRDRLGFELDWVSLEQMDDWVRSNRYGSGLLESDAFCFNPLEYVQALAHSLRRRNVAVVGRTPVQRLNRRGDVWLARTPTAEIRARQVVLATGGDGTRLHARAHAGIQPIATYIIVTEPLGERLQQLMPGGAAVYDTRFAFDYYRPLPDGRLLWGGRISTAARKPPIIRRLLYRDLLRVFPGLAGCRIDYAWGGWMGYARHQMPVLTEIEPELWTALGFGGHGLATTALAGEVLAEAMTGDRGRIEHFRRWGPVWAGGAIGRAAVQAVYWWKQGRDRVRSRGPAPS